MAGQQAAAADAEFRIALAGLDAVDQLDAGPDAAGILPAAAGAAEPFAEDGARGHQAALVFLERAGERVDLAGGAHAHRDQAGQQVGGDGKARALRNVVHLADDFDAVAGLAGEPREQVGERLGGAFHARRHDAAGDHGGLQQAQIVAREIEDLGDRGDVGRGLQVDAGEAQHGLIDDAEVGLHRRLRHGIRRGRAAHGEIDGDVQHARAFGEIHAEEEDVAPAAVGQVHADGRGLAQDGEEPARRREVRGAGAADSRRDGRCGTSTGCRARCARCGAPGRPGSGRRET